MLVSVIIPCYNESAVIAATIARLGEVLGDDAQHRGYDYELIFVDDGSGDDTLKRLKELPRQMAISATSLLAGILARKPPCWQD